MLNKDIQSRNFPSRQQLAHQTLIFKKCLRCEYDNYRPVIIVSTVSKLFDRPLFKQMSLIFEQIFYHIDSGLKKGINPQHYFIAMLEKWKLSKDHSNSF